MMRKAFNVLLIFTITIIVSLSSPRKSFAQGTYKCVMMPPSQGSNCVLQQNNCTQGHKPPPSDCALFSGLSNKNVCENVQHDCISEEAATDCKTKEDLFPPYHCPDGYPKDCGRSNLCCKTQESCDILPIATDSSCQTDTGYGVNTALGCIPANNLNNFVAWFLSKLIFVASGIAFLLMAFGAFRILTSAGSPEKMQAGKELITSALAGLIFIILSLFLLKLIGVDILQIPGFGK